MESSETIMVGFHGIFSNFCTCKLREFAQRDVWKSWRRISCHLCHRRISLSYFLASRPSVVAFAACQVCRSCTFCTWTEQSTLARGQCQLLPNIDEQVIPALRGGLGNAAPQEGDFVPTVEHISRLHYGLPGFVGLKPPVVPLQLLSVGRADVLHVAPSLLVQLG